MPNESLSYAKDADNDVIVLQSTKAVCALNAKLNIDFIGRL